MPPGTREPTTVDRLGDLLWKAIPAIGSAIGFVGFIAVVGAALQWLRFEAVGLPAVQALLAMPRQELVIIGSLELFPAVLLGLLASLLVYMFDSRGDANIRTARGIVIVATAEVIASLYITELSDGLLGLFLVWAFVLGAALMCFAEALTPHFTRRRKLKRLRREVLSSRAALAIATDLDPGGGEAHLDLDVNLSAAQRRLERTAREWKATADTLARGGTENQVQAATATAIARDPATDQPPAAVELEKPLDEAEALLGGAGRAILDWFRRPSWRIELGIGLLLGVLTGVVSLLLHGAGRWALVVSVAAVLLAVTNMFIAHGTEKFLWYGVAVFFSVVVFGALMSMARAFHYPEAQPVALLRKNNETGICGVFVTQTSERVYIGRLPQPGRPGLLFWVPTTEVELVSVGQSQEIQSKNPFQLQDDESALLRRLYVDRAEEAPTTVKNPTKTVVSGTAGAKTSQTTTTTEAQAPKYQSTPHKPVSVQGTSCRSTLDPPPHHKKLGLPRRLPSSGL